ncbi:DUF4328 domain-containing protein [Nocardia pseudovaccinii]|uniref:DUF4328 domain-containing protein n=1 Tax=Nocardia pseudovaccinii TaxID=189540 RepID=UPI003D8C399A
MQAFGLAAIVLVAGTVVMLSVSVIIDWIDLSDFERSWQDHQQMPEEWSSDSLTGVVASLLLLGAGIVVIVWLWLARRNAEALCAARHRLAIGWVIGGWFCPVVNLWFPHMILADVVRASDPRTPADARDLRRRPTGVLVTVWWLALMAGWVLTAVSVRLSAPQLRTERTDDYFVYASGPAGGQGLIIVEIFSVGAFAVAAFCLSALIIQVQQWQGIRASSRDCRRPGTGTGSAPATRTPATMLWPTTHVATATSPTTQAPHPGPTPLLVKSSTLAGRSALPDPHTLPMRDSDPSAIGPYTLVGRLGSDAVGDRYLGHTTDMTKVVLRTVHHHHATGADAHAELARVFTAARIVHSDFTPTVLDADADAPQPWIATAHIAGPSLHELVTDRGPLPPTMVESIATGVARALSALHNVGLVHGALTPSSVIVTESGTRVVDFGITTPPAEPSAFAAPEQLVGEAAGRASDVFAMGGVLTYALTGRAPFGDANPATLLHRMRTVPPDLTGIPDSGLRFVITGCLTGHPDARLTTAQVLGHLEATGAPQSRPTTPTQLPQETPTIAAYNDGDFPFDIVIAVLAIPASIVGGFVVFHSSDESARSAANPARSAGAAMSTTAAPETWGDVQWIADLFPNLLPTNPSPSMSGQIPSAADGYQGINCPHSSADQTMVICPVERSVRNPSVQIYCSQGRQYGVPPGHGDVFLERLPRQTGSVTIWRAAESSTSAAISLSFDDSRRSQCTIYSTWNNHSEGELVNWWRAAPL